MSTSPDLFQAASPSVSFPRLLLISWSFSPALYSGSVCERPGLIWPSVYLHCPHPHLPTSTLTFSSSNQDWDCVAVPWWLPAKNIYVPFTVIRSCCRPVSSPSSCLSAHFWPRCPLHPVPRTLMLWPPSWTRQRTHVLGKQHGVLPNSTPTRFVTLELLLKLSTPLFLYLQKWRQ